MDPNPGALKNGDHYSFSGPEPFEQIAYGTYLLEKFQDKNPGPLIFKKKIQMRIQIRGHENADLELQAYL